MISPNTQVLCPLAIRQFTFWLLVALCLVFADDAAAASAEICDAAASSASREMNVPLNVLRAVTRTETGRGSDLRPWPWAVNMEGKGHWFETEGAARAFVFKHFKRGARKFDIGCFQINYKWHGHSFQSIEQMFDPIENARYAAQFLADLHAETGSWALAAGAYHSRTPKHAKDYSARFQRIYAALDSQLPAQITQADSQEAFGLAIKPKTRKYGRRGSLVPVDIARNGALFSGGS